MRSRNVDSHDASSRLSQIDMLLPLLQISVVVTRVAGLATALQQPFFEHPTSGEQQSYPTPPQEPIEITSISLPPVVASEDPGACSYSVNSHGTGCIGQATGLQAGNFLPDGNHVLATVRFVGAPAAPDPRSVFDGQQLLILKADGTLFPNGDTWKCLTCGVPEDQKLGVGQLAHEYPQAFSDGKRILTGSSILDCGQGAVDQRRMWASTSFYSSHSPRRQGRRLRTRCFSS